MEPSRDSLVTCLDWAKEGERQIRAGRLSKGIGFLDAALEAKTDDTTLLSAIYSQLGNAFYSLGDYGKARMYHIYDFQLAKLMKDVEGQAKAAGNVGNTFKAQGSYSEAEQFTSLQLKIAKELGDKKLEANALFHMGTIYFAKAKHEGRSLRGMMGNLSSISLRPMEAQAMREDAEKSIEFFKRNLELLEAAGDRNAVGRTYGCLGNSHYLIRELETAVEYHKKRLEVAREFGDKGTQKKVYMNLGNTYVLMGLIEQALEYYRLALSLALELRDKLGQAQSSFSLATASSLADDYQTAADYHVRHLTLARELRDTAGESRALSSLGNAYKRIGDYPKAAYFLARNRSIAKEMHDQRALETAETSLKDLIHEAGRQVLRDDEELLLDTSADPQGEVLPPLRLSLSLGALQDFDDCGLSRQDVFQSDGELTTRPSAKSRTMSQGQEEFFDMISRMQMRRMDEQRCDAKILNDISNTKQPRFRDTRAPSPSASVSSSGSKKSGRRLSIFGRVTSTILRDSRPLFTSTPVKKHKSTASFFPSFNSKRADSFASLSSEPTASIPVTPEIPEFRVPQLPPRATTAQENRRQSMFAGETPQPPPRRKRDSPEALIDQLMQAQGRRMDEQRAHLLPGGGRELLDKLQGAAELEGAIDEQLLEMVARAQGQRMNEQRSELGGRTKEDAGNKPDHAPTIPEDDLSDLVARMQKGRLEEQRAHLAEKEG